MKREGTLVTTSRTGTTNWIRNAATAKRRARAAGLTHCPSCGVPLRWDIGRTPASPEADHIIPHSLGGTDRLDNIRIICRHCNQSRGNGVPRKHQRFRRVEGIDHRNQW
ncbi:HNH endonuclease [uncultured Cutibacterium sp.]|uniref:HNH endonuclease n=1 Tax=uncultured Cutibacterium sp. TaxID=1912223 RepID=UPI0035A6A477